MKTSTLAEPAKRTPTPDSAIRITVRGTAPASLVLDHATIAVGNREDLIDQIYMISPADTPFQANVAKNKATAVLHEWQTDTLAAAGTNAQLEGDE